MPTVVPSISRIQDQDDFNKVLINGYVLSWNASTQQFELVATQPVDPTLTALAAFNTNGFMVQTAADVFTGRTLLGVSGVTIDNGNGVLANPTIGVALATPTSNGALSSGDFVKIGGISAGVWVVHDDGTSTQYKPSADSDAARGTALTTALAAAVSTDTIYVNAGTYNVSSNIAKNGVNWVFDPGVTINHSGFTYLFSDGGSAFSFVVHGKLNIISSSSVGVIKTNHASTDIVINFNNIDYSGGLNAVDSIKGNLTLNGKSIKGTDGAALSSCIYWENGDLKVTLDQLGDSTKGNYGFWAVCGSVSLDAMTGRAWLSVKEYYDHGAMSISGNTAARIWMDCQEFNATITLNGPLFYLSTLKYFGYINNFAAGTLYITTQKFSPTVTSTLTGGTSFLQLGQIEDSSWLTGTNPLFTISGGTQNFAWGTLTKSVNGNAFDVSAGTLNLLTGSISTQSTYKDVNRTGGTLNIFPNVSFDTTKTAGTLTYPAAADLLAMLLTVDGTTSGLDADLLDGFHASSFQGADPTLTALAAFNTNGLLTQTAADTFTARTLTGVSGIAIDNPGGVGGNPIIGISKVGDHQITGILTTAHGGTSLDTSAAGNGKLLIGNGTGFTLANLTQGNNITITNSAGGISIAATSASGLNVGTGIVVQTGVDLFGARGLFATAPLVVTNSDGVTGNPTFSITAASSGSAGSMSSGNFAKLTNISLFAETLLDDANAAAMRATLGSVIGTDVEAHDATLTALASYNTNGLLTQTAADTFTGRTLTGVSGIGIDNPAGVGGNPIIGVVAIAESQVTNLVTDLGNKQPLDGTLTALAAFNTNGVLVQTAADTFVGRTLIGASGITIRNGNGVSNDPVIYIAGSGDLPNISEAQVTNLVTDLAAKQNLDATLTALAAFNTNGLLTQTSADTFAGRTLTGVSGIGIDNPAGIGGNPIIGLVSIAESQVANLVSDLAAKALAATTVVIHKDGTQTAYNAASNTDAARGTALLSAVSGMAVGEACVAGPGRFDIGNSYLHIPLSGCLIGKSMHDTYIRSTWITDNIVAVGVNPYCVVSDLTIEMTGVGYPAGVANSTGYDKSVWRNVKVIGAIDGWIWTTQATPNDTTYLYNCIAETNWDCFTLVSTGKAILYDCEGYCDGKNTNSAGTVFKTNFGSMYVIGGRAFCSGNTTLNYALSNNGSLGTFYAKDVFSDVRGTGTNDAHDIGYFGPMKVSNITRLDGAAIVKRGNSTLTWLDANPTMSNVNAATSGQVVLARGGTNADLSATGGTGQVLKQTSAGAAITVGALASGEIPTISEAQVSNLVTDLAAKQPLDATLTALAAFNSNGIITQTAADTFSSRTLTAVSGIGIDNANGVGGNPVIGVVAIAESQVTNLVTDLGNKQPLDATLTALAAYNTNGLLTQTGADTFAGRTLTGVSGITIDNPAGVGGNPIIGLLAISESQVTNLVSDLAGKALAATTVVIHRDGTQTAYNAASNTDAARGTALLNAVSGMVNGDACIVGNGIFDIGDNYLIIPHSGSLIGYGRNTTFIKSRWQSTTFPCLGLNPYGLAANFSVEHTGLGYPVGVAGSAGFDKTIWSNVRVSGVIDGWIWTSQASSNDTAYLFNCVSESQWDCFTLVTTGKAVLYNCEGYCDGRNTNSAGTIFKTNFGSMSVIGGKAVCSGNTSLNYALSNNGSSDMFYAKDVLCDVRSTGINSAYDIGFFGPMKVANIVRLDGAAVVKRGNSTLTWLDANQSISVINAASSGQVLLARGGTSADLSATGGTGQVLKQTSAGAAVTVAALASGEIPTISEAQVSNLKTDLDGKQPLDGTLTALAAFNTNGFLAQTSADNFAGRTLTGVSGVGIDNAAGIGGNPVIGVVAIAESQVTNLVTDLGNKQPLDATLTALAAFNSNGIITQTSADTFSARTLTAVSGIGIDNAGGVGGNPVIGVVAIAESQVTNLVTDLGNKQPLDATLTALAAYNTNGFLAQTAADTFAGRTLTGVSGITIDNGNGVSANPTIGLAFASSGNAGALSSGDFVKVSSMQAGVWLVKANGDSTQFKPLVDSDAARGEALINAKTAAVSTDMVYAGPGGYTITANLLKNGVNYYFAPGSVITNSTSGNPAPVHIFDDLGQTASANIFGYGQFVRNAYGRAGSFGKGGVISISGSYTQFNMVCKSLTTISGDNAVIQSYQGNIRIQGEDLLGTESFGVDWNNGDIKLKFKNITTTGFKYPIWPTVTSATPSGSMWVEADEIVSDNSCIATAGSSTTQRTWVIAKRLRSTGTSAPFAVEVGFGLLYVIAEKLEGGVTMLPYSTPTLYLNTQKIAALPSMTNLLDLGGGTSFINIGEVDDVNTPSYLFGVSQGTHNVSFLTANRATNGDATNVTGGTLNLIQGKISTQGGYKDLSQSAGTLNVGPGIIFDSSKTNGSYTRLPIYGTTPSTFGLSILDDADAATARATLGVVIGTNVQAADGTLTALAAYNTNGLLTQTAADTFTGRTLTGVSGIGVDNPAGVGGNPIIGVVAIAESQVTNLVTDLGNKQAADATLTALAAYNTNGILTQTAADTFTGRTITAVSGLSLDNGNGVGGNPTIGLSQLPSGGIPFGSGNGAWVTDLTNFFYNWATNRLTLGGDLFMSSTSNAYWGDPNTDGSFREVRNTKGALLTQKRVGGLWVTMDLRAPTIQLICTNTVNIDADSGCLYDILATGNYTVNTPTNGFHKQKITYSNRQDSTGGRTISFGAGFRFGASVSGIGSVTASTGVSKVDHAVFMYHSGDAKWDIVSFAPGY